MSSFAPDHNDITDAMQICAVIASWVVLYQFNAFVFKFTEVIPAVNLVFLPAMLRVVAVLVCGWKGALGLGIGALLTMSDADLSRPMANILVDVVINIVGPLCAVAVGKRLMQVPDSLNGLRSSHIVMFSILGGVSNALFHQPLHLMMPEHPGFFDATVTMFVGDMIGCAIMLYAMSFTLRMVQHLRKA
jgi:hypothetical protein